MDLAYSPKPSHAQPDRNLIMSVVYVPLMPSYSSSSLYSFKWIFFTIRLVGMGEVYQELGGAKHPHGG